ncbi:response regulator, partial [bacterium]
QHEGWINVESELLKGTTFKIYIPAFSGKLSDRISETNVIEDLKGKGEKILLVEDDQRMREFTMNFLNENGYVVSVASNAKEGMDLFVKNNGDFHLIFSDIILTDKSGIELVKEFRSIKPNIRILLSSGYTDDKVQWYEIKRKRFQYIQKPYKLHELLRTIKDNVTFIKMSD